jgi:hypothetical protein
LALTLHQELENSEGLFLKADFAIAFVQLTGSQVQPERPKADVVAWFCRLHGSELSLRRSLAFGLNGLQALPEANARMPNEVRRGGVWDQFSTRHLHPARPNNGPTNQLVRYPSVIQA